MRTLLVLFLLLDPVSAAIQDNRLSRCCDVLQACPHLWVGNIGPNVTEDELRFAFEKASNTGHASFSGCLCCAQYGKVDNVRILSKNSVCSDSSPSVR